MKLFSTVKIITVLGLASILAVSGCTTQATPVYPQPEKPIPYPGNDIDAQEQELAGFLNSQGISFHRDGANLVIHLPEAITFATNSATLKSQATPVLNRIAQVLNKYTSSRINIIGYTDSTGTDAINNRLSLQRAQSVSTVFENNGIGKFRLNPVGAGSKNPIATNDTATGRAQNRRVEITIVPMQLKR